MKRLFLWIVMVLLMVALLLGGAGAGLDGLAQPQRTDPAPACRTPTPRWGRLRWNPTVRTGRCRCWGST